MPTIKTNAGEVGAQMRALAVQFPREFKMGLSTFGVWLRNKIIASLRANAAPLNMAPWAEMTKRLKGSGSARHMKVASYWKSQRARLAAKHGKSWRSTDSAKTMKARERTARDKAGFYEGMGGHLAKTVEYRNDGRVLTIGYMPALEPWARKFQQTENRTLTKEERHFRHVIGEKDMRYRRPAREIIMPFVRDPQTMQDALRIVAGRINALFSRNTRLARAA